MGPGSKQPRMLSQASCPVASPGLGCSESPGGGGQTAIVGELWTAVTHVYTHPPLLAFYNIYLWLHLVSCCEHVWAFSGCDVWASHGADLLRSRSARLVGCSRCGTRAVCPSACWIFQDYGLNLCLLHWRMDSSPLNHEESPSLGFFGWSPAAVKRERARGAVGEAGPGLLRGPGGGCASAWPLCAVLQSLRVDEAHTLSFCQGANFQFTGEGGLIFHRALGVNWKQLRDASASF